MVIKKKGQDQRKRMFLIVPKGHAGEKQVALTGAVALQATSNGFLSASSLEAARRAIRKAVRKTGQLVIRAAAFLPITRKPAEVRMGKGKGKIKGYVVPVKAGRVLFELRSIPFWTAQKAFLRAATKLAVSTRTIELKDRFSWKD